MNVHLLKASDYSCEKVLELLCEPSKALKFSIVDYNLEDKILSFEEIWEICNAYREQKKVPDTDFVVLLTAIPNTGNYFSFFDANQNAFVHTDNWDLFGIGNEAYPIAYEVAANILQSLMHLRESHIHFRSIGCMNDMCTIKADALLKLRTGDVCPDCLAEIQQQNINDDIVNHVLAVFEAVRLELKWVQGFRRNQKPQQVEITQQGKIKIGGKLITLNPMEKMLMIFFLRHPEGLILDDLHQYEDELLSIYLTLRPSKDGAELQIENLVQPYYQNVSFSTTKSRLNTSLKRALGEPHYRFYQLIRLPPPHRTFKINLAAELITDHFMV